MKKLNYSPVIVWLVATVFAISCTKESAPLAAVDPLATSSLQSSIPEIGGLIDLGLINSETRVMATTFNTKSVELDGENVDLMQSPAQVTLTIYVNQDAQIPAGEYAFSNSITKFPFSFD